MSAATDPGSASQYTPALEAAGIEVADRHDAAHVVRPNPPERLAYQGYLTDGGGNPLGSPNPRNYDIIFRIWDGET